MRRCNCNLSLIHDLTFDVFALKGLILKQLIQGIVFIEYAKRKNKLYGSECNKKGRPVHRVRFP